MKFKSGYMGYEDSQTFNEAKHFSQFDHFERYDESKEYPLDVFDYDFGHGLHHYQYFVERIRLYHGTCDNFIEERIYLVAEEKLTDTEVQEYAKYCQCHQCRMWRWNPFRRFICAVDSSRFFSVCLKNPSQLQQGRYDPTTIKKTREYMRLCGPFSP